MSEKELLSNLMEKCLSSNISPVRISYSVDSSKNCVSNNSVIEKEFEEEHHLLYVSGVYNNKIVHFELSRKLDSSYFDLIIDELKKHVGEDYKKEWFVNPGMRLGKTDAFSNKIEQFFPNNKISSTCIEIDNLIKQNAKELTSVSTQVKKYSGMTWLISSNNLDLFYKRNGVSISSKATKSIDFESQNGFRSINQLIYEDTRSYHKNIDLLNTKNFANIIINGFNELTSSCNVNPGIYNVIFAPKAASKIVSCGLKQLSGKKVYEHKSYYENDMGKDVFSPLLTVLNDPFIASDYARPFDWEGTPTEKFMAIDHGRLRCFFLDNKYGELLNILTNGCNYKYNDCACQYLVVSNGENPISYLINDLKNGIVLKNFLENIEDCIDEETLDFTIKFQGVLIDNENRTAIRGTLQGNVAQILANIEAISKEREDTGGCLCPAFVVKNVEVFD